MRIRQALWGICVPPLSPSQKMSLTCGNKEAGGVRSDRVPPRLSERLGLPIDPVGLVVDAGRSEDEVLGLSPKELLLDEVLGSLGLHELEVAGLDPSL